MENRSCLLIKRGNEFLNTRSALFLVKREDYICLTMDFFTKICQIQLLNRASSAHFIPKVLHSHIITHTVRFKLLIQFIKCTHLEWTLPSILLLVANLCNVLRSSFHYEACDGQNLCGSTSEGRGVRARGGRVSALLRSLLSRVSAAQSTGHHSWCNEGLESMRRMAN